MMQDLWNAPPLGIRPSKSAPCSPLKPPLQRTRSESFHIAHKVPIGDTPYVKAKHVQLVDKDPEKAIALFWAAINAGDRVDSALKDMAIVMKQQNRAEEAIEAIKSLRGRCSEQAQESLDNILLDLYKKCGRLNDQIALLQHKLFLIQQGLAFNGKRTKTARSQGKKFQVSVDQEATRLLGNLGWAYMQQQNYIEAEGAYRRALSVAPDNNKMCNLGICLMKQGRIAEAKETLRKVRPAVVDGPRGVDSHLKAFERAQEMLRDLESEMMTKALDKFKQGQLFDEVLGSSSIWQPQPCIDRPFTGMPKQQEDDGLGDENLDFNRIMAENMDGILPPLQKTARIMNLLPFIQPALLKQQQDGYGDENFDLNRIIRGETLAENMGGALPPLQRSYSAKTINPTRNLLNIGAPPFYSKLSTEPLQPECIDPLGPLKWTRSGNMAGFTRELQKQTLKEPNVEIDPPGQRSRRRSLSLDNEGTDDKWLLGTLPDDKELDDAIVAAILEPYKKTGMQAMALQKKRFKVFQDITPSLSPRA